MDVWGKMDRFENINQKIKNDSIAIALTIDSAKIAYQLNNLVEAIQYAEKTFELAKKNPNTESSIQSILILSRSYKALYIQDNLQNYLNYALKYYLKAITTLEFVESKVVLPSIYIEFGDFYGLLNLPELTIKNYEKALKCLEKEVDFELQETVIEKLASLNQELGNIDGAIHYYNKLIALYQTSKDQIEEIAALKIVSELYRTQDNYDQAIFVCKEIYAYYLRIGDEPNQIDMISKIAEISYESGNRDQSDKAFKQYFALVKKDDRYLTEEVASLRYVKNLVTEGDIYSWSLANGYWSDFETAIRYYNTAQKHIDVQSYPDLTSTIFNRTGSVYFKKKEFKTCITFFELALYYAKITNNLEGISDNHIMLARAFDAIEKWKEASGHYEMHAAYKDSIIRKTAQKQQALANQLIDSKKENNIVEQTLDKIEAQERQELAYMEKELRNVALENEVELYRQDVALKEMQIQNQKLAEDSARRNFMLATQQLQNEHNAEKIEQLRLEKEKQDLELRNKEAEQQNERQRIKILEQENAIAQSRQAYYVFSIVLISLILISILVIYILKRRANKKLQHQNDKIEQQSEKLKQAYKNLELLSTIGRDITSSLIIEEIIETVYENLNSLMDASVLGIGVYDKEKNSLYFPGVRERNQRLSDIQIDLSANNMLAAHCFNYQKELILDNFHESYTDFINPETLPTVGDGNSSSIVYIPLTISDKKLGVLTVQSFDIKAFNEYHINIIRNIAIYAKIALENANVYRELEIQSMNLKRANKNINKQNKLIEEQYHQLVSINEEKNNLINILAHDLRNPLATAMSMTELVRFERNNLSAEQYHASEIIWRGLTRMNDMISKILDIKAVESQKINLEFEVLDVRELMVPLEKLFETKAKDKQIELHFACDTPESLIKIDRSYLIQVMENLISNALKFSPAHRNVFIRIFDVKDWIHISVRDEGPGIPEHEFDDLFVKYKKLSPRPTAGEQSIGLGLSIVKKYVEVMGGKVWCESKVDKGTAFFVAFQKETVPASGISEF
jgi:signal transduction histidine kinase